MKVCVFNEDISLKMKLFEIFPGIQLCGKKDADVIIYPKSVELENGHTAKSSIRICGDNYDGIIKCLKKLAPQFQQEYVMDDSDPIL